jgi:subtilisin family serine protease
MPKLRHLMFLALAMPVIGLWQDASAEVRFGRGPTTMRSFGGRGFGPGGGPAHTFAGFRNHGFSHIGGPPGGGPAHTFAGFRNHGFSHIGGPGAIAHFGHAGDHAGGGRLGHAVPHALQHGPSAAGRPQFHNPSPIAGMARNGLPRRPFPGEPGFTGVPPRGESRFVSREMVVHVDPDVSPQVLDAAARRLGLTAISSQNLALSGGRMVHFRVRGDVSDAIRTLEADKIGIAQPNYLFELQQDVHMVAALPPEGDPAQYVIDKLHLREAHTLASGSNVMVAVIDSLIDTTHPDIAGSIIGQYDAVAATDKPDEHGTGMTGAIAAHRRLLGVAPHARILAIHAFSPDAKHPQQATTQSIVAGIDWAIGRGAKVINMSFAGPYDPMLQLALKKAHEKGVVLIAAAGNMGPQSPPLYPAADENVIAVTAVDDKDKLMPQANQGPHVALAAPGVNVIEAAPRATYNFTTGTSVAAAHVSGVAALILERSPGIDVASLEEILFSTARDLGAPGRDPQFGYGLVDPYRALTAVDNKAIVRSLPAPETTASANPRQLTGGTAPKSPTGEAEAVLGTPAGSIGPTAPRVGAMAPAGESSGEAADRHAPPYEPVTPAALPHPRAGSDEAAVIEKKRQACRQAGADQGVAASEMADYVDVCVSEARLACLKQAVVHKVPALERRDFLNRCLQGS